VHPVGSYCTAKYKNFKIFYVLTVINMEHVELGNSNYSSDCE